MTEILDYIQPTDLIYIAIDGVAPMSKMKHQRLRRFKSVKEQEIRNEILMNYNQDIPVKWNNTVITPGTNFMKKLSVILLKFAKNYKPLYSNKLKIILSTSNTHGEGEHKIHQYLKEQNNKDAIKVVYGLDADLIFLTLATHLPKLYVFREAQHIDEKSTNKFLMIDMDLLKDGIYEDIQSKCENIIDKESVINDYIILGFLLGNDFLPNIPSLTLSPIHPKIENGLDILLNIYPKFIDDHEYLYKCDESLIEFFKILSDLEENYFKTVFERGRIYMKTTETDPCKIALFEFDNLIRSDINSLKIGKDNPIEYKKRYYNHFFHTNNKKTIESICKEYLIGLSWVKQYYFEDCPDWLWLYKHHQVPFISDLYEYMKEIKTLPVISKQNNKFSVRPLDQLMMVVPPENAKILPIECHSIYTNSKLRKYFPKEYDFDIHMKNKFWMCYPEIPNPMYNDFMSEINKIIFSDESIKLNKNFKPHEINLV
jgi:5'-3' exonuclease